MPQLEVRMRERQDSEQLMQIGEFVVDFVSGEIRRGRECVRLKPQVCRVLSLLAEKPGRIVLRDEIQREVWGGDTFVDFERGLNSCIKQIRAAFGDEPDAPHYIETIPRRGYRLIAPVEPVALVAEEGPEVCVPHQSLASQVVNQLSIKRPVIWALLAIVAIAGITLGVSREHRSAAGTIRIVVLPFDNLSHDPEQEFFSDGLAEEMITELGRVSPQRLGVIAQTSSARYKRSGKSISEIGKELNVDYVLEGSVRRDGKQMHVTSQLIKAADQTQVWAESYDRPVNDTFVLESELTDRVANALALNPRATSAEVRLIPATQNSEAHEVYLRGRYELNRMTPEGILKARAHLEKAVGLDPKFALAYAALSDTYSLEPWWGNLTPREASPRAKAMAEQALRLDKESAEAHSALGVVRFYYDWDFRGAEREFERAIQLQPGLAIAHYWYAGVLSAEGRHPEAIAAIQRAQELDPLSPVINADAGWYYFYARRYDEAVRECQRALEADPQFGFAVSCILASHRQQHNYQAALADAKQLMEIRATKTGEPAPSLAAPDVQSGLRSAAGIWLQRLNKLSPHTYISLYQVAALRMWLDDKDQALADLNRAREQRDLLMVFVDVDPRMDSLRSDPRFASFRTGLHFR
jgi:TolB-like protein/DNA-binding winged helix-turn-helix (wHTH) protein/Flp pilus assembly protein TadD